MEGDFYAGQPFQCGASLAMEASSATGPHRDWRRHHRRREKIDMNRSARSRRATALHQATQAPGE